MVGAEGQLNVPQGQAYELDLLLVDDLSSLVFENADHAPLIAGGATVGKINSNNKLNKLPADKYSK